MTAIFRPHANTLAKLALAGAVLLAVAGLFWWWVWPRTDYMLHVGFTVNEPVPFSHQHHVAALGIDCRFCHTGVETGNMAGMPPSYTCMTCHSEIWANAKMLAPVRQSLADGRPLAWAYVTTLPDYVYFNHSIHVAKGVGCSECHGQMDRMPLTYQAKSMTMGFCLSCHRNPGPHLRPESEITNTEWVRTAGDPTPAALMKHYHIGGRTLTDCSICHR